MDLDQLVDAINKQVNIPLLNEEQEKVLIKAVVQLLVSLLLKRFKIV